MIVTETADQRPKTVEPATRGSSVWRHPRVVTPERMDDPSLPDPERVAALAGLRRINRVSNSAGVIWRELQDLLLAPRRMGRPLRILDVATGSGDVPIALWRRAARSGAVVEIAGCDISEPTIQLARTRAAAVRAPIEFFSCDALAADLPVGFDVITASLFLHHLTHDDAVRLLRRCGAAAGLRVVVNDLRRSPLGVAVAWLGTRVLSRSAVVHFDGVASARAAFTPSEAAALAEAAGLRGARVARRWPWRFVLRWDRR